MFGFGILPAYGYLAVVLVCLAGMYFVRFETVKNNWLFLLLFNQYFSVAIGLNLFHDGDWATNPNNPFYALMIALSVPLVALYSTARNQQGSVFYPLALGVITSVGLLVWQFSGSECRVMGYTFNPLGTSALFLIVGFVLLSLGHQIGGAQKVMSWVILGFVIYAILGPAGSRMPFFAGILGVVLFGIYFSRVDGLSCAMKFMFTTLAVFTLSMSVSVNFKDCGIKQRLVDNLTTVRLIFQSGDQVVIGEAKDGYLLRACGGTEAVTDKPFVEDQDASREEQPRNAVAQSPVEQVNSIGMPTSEGYRFILWLSAFRQWQHEKLLGFGQSNEETVLGLSCTGQPHSHNQLLSWLVSGGILLLLSGLIFVSAPIVTSKNALMALLTIAPIAGSQLTDSLLNLHSMIVSISVALPAVLIVRRVS